MIREGFAAAFTHIFLPPPRCSVADDFLRIAVWTGKALAKPFVAEGFDKLDNGSSVGIQERSEAGQHLVLAAIIKSTNYRHGLAKCDISRFPGHQSLHDQVGLVTIASCCDRIRRIESGKDPERGKRYDQLNSLTELFLLCA